MACDLWLVVDKDQSNEFPDLIELVFDFEFFEGVVVIEVDFVFKLFESMVVFELFDRPSTFRIDLVIIELAFVFELLEGVVGFEYIHSSFPNRRRSPGYPIFSEMKSSLKFWSEVFSEVKSSFRTNLNFFRLWT